MAKQYTFRVDELEGVTRDSVVTWLTKNVGAHTVCREISDKTKKPHYQGWIWSDLSAQTLGNRIKSQWPNVKGTRGRSTGGYSCAPVRKDTYELYVLKGTREAEPDIVSMQPRVGEVLDVSASWRQYWSRDTSAVPKNMHIVDEAIEFYKAYTWSEDEDVYIRRRHVAKWMYDKMVELKKTSFDSYRTRGWLNAVCARTDPEFREVFVTQVEQNI